MASGGLSHERGARKRRGAGKSRPRTVAPAFVSVPRAAGAWVEVAVDGEGGRRALLLVREELGGADDERVARAILARPALATDAGGAPRLSVTFVLDRQPGVSEPDLRERIERATVGLDLTVAPEPWMLARVAGGQALFAREATFRIGSLAESTVANGQLGASLAATLDRAAALELLDALRGEASGLEATASIAYRDATVETGTLWLATDLARVHARLAPAAAEPPVFYDRDLENYLAALIESGVVSIEGPGPGLGSNQDAHALAQASRDAFVRVCAFLFERLPDDERVSELGRRYLLSPSAPASMPVRIRVARSELAGALERVEARIALDELLGGTLDRDDAERLVHFVALDSGGRGVVPLARRVRTSSAARARATRPHSLALVGDRISTLAAAVQPTLVTAAPAHTLLLANVAELHAPVAVATTAGPPARNLPVLKEGSAPPWPDRLDANLRWYLPELVPVVPAATATAEAAPFRFAFRAAGHDVAGRAGLEATIVVTLERRVPAAVAAELERLGSGVRGEPVAMRDVSVELEIPFRVDGRTTVERFRAIAVEQGSSLVATFALLDDWARLAYGALAYAGYQAQPARVSVAYGYEGYVARSTMLAQLIGFGGKIVAAPVELQRGRSRARGRSTLDPRDGTVRLADGTEVRFAPIGRAASRGAKRPFPHALLASLQPEVAAPVHVLDTLRRTEYVEVARVHEAACEALFPCSEHGALYLEERESDGAPEAVPIGCQIAMALGEAELRLYDEVELPQELRSVGRVHRSLQTPGRFVLVPATYRVSRYGPADGERAWRPAILLYSTIDIEDLAKSRCVIVATLEPAATEAELARVLDHLRRNEHAEARLEPMTEVAGELVLEWPLPESAGDLLRIEVDAARTPYGFEVTLATDAFGLPQLQEILARSGISGTATLTLADGSCWQTALRLHLAELVGPRPHGPLEAQFAPPGTLTLTNRIESTVLVGDLVLLDGGDAVVEIRPAELRIDPGESKAVELGAVAGNVLPAYSVESRATTLEEIRSFIEDITVEVLLHNRIDLASFDLARVEVEVRVAGMQDVERAAFDADSEVAQSVRFLLPLTAYLASPSLELTATLTDEAGAARQVGPLPWRLGTDGQIVSLTPALLGLQ